MLFKKTPIWRLRLDHWPQIFFPKCTCFLLLNSTCGFFNRAPRQLSLKANNSMQCYLSLCKSQIKHEAPRNSTSLTRWLARFALEKRPALGAFRCVSFNQLPKPKPKPNENDTGQQQHDNNNNNNHLRRRRRHHLDRAMRSKLHSKPLLFHCLCISINAPFSYITFLSRHSLLNKQNNWNEWGL